MSEPRARSGGRTRRLPRRPAAVVLAVGLAALAAAALAILLQAAPRRSGTNGTPGVGPIALAPGQQLCEPGELLPGDTAALRLRGSLGAAHAAGGPAIAASVTGPSGPVGAGLLAAGWRPGLLRIPIGRVRHTIGGVTVCLRNEGSRAAGFTGSVPYGASLVTIDGRPLGGRLRIEYMRPGSESWLALAPTLAHRFSLAKADLLRDWEAFAVLVLMALAIGVAVRTALAAEREA